MIGRTRRQALLLERYWTMLRRAPQVERPDRLDPGLAETAACLSELTAELQPPGAAIAAGRERVARAASELAGRRAWTGPEITPRSRAVGDAADEDDRTAPPARTVPEYIDFEERQSLRRQLLQLAAAVLVFAIVAAVLVLVLRTSDPQPAELVPTATPTAVPSPTPGASSTPTVLPALATAQPTATAAATATDAPASTPEPVPTPDVTGIGTLAAIIPTSADPWDVALAAGSVWVSNEVDGTVSRIDPATNEIVATIAIGESGPGGAGASWLAATDEAVWVVNENALAIARIDPSTNEVVGTIDLPSGTPTAFAVSGIAYGHGSLWVTDASSNARLVRLNPETGAVEAEIAVDVPQGVAVSADAVWVSNYEANTVTRIDPATNQIVAAIQVGGAPVDLEVSEGTAWIGNRSSGSVSRIDATINEVVATIDIFLPGSSSQRVQPAALAVGAGAVWVTDRGALYRIDPTTNTVVASAPIAMARLEASESDLWITSPPVGVLRVTPAS